MPFWPILVYFLHGRNQSELDPSPLIKTKGKKKSKLMNFHLF